MQCVPKHLEKQLSAFMVYINLHLQKTVQGLIVKHPYLSPKESLSKDITW